MTDVGKAFLGSLGHPDPPLPNGLEFENRAARRLWGRLHSEIGSGWFSDRFLFLFAQGVESLAPCLEAWSFIVPPGRERMILGRNAYGALLVAEEPTRLGLRCPIYVLDPLNVRYWTNPHLTFVNLIGNWLPQGRLPDFTDRRLYRAWIGAAGGFLAPTEILAIIVPKSLGGQMVADNFMVEDIVSYYVSTGRIYAKTAQKPARR